MTDNFDFEWFDKRSIPKTDRPRVGIQKRGIFSLNRAAHEALGSPSHVKLAFDKARQVIGIAAADPGEAGAQAVRKQPNSSSYLFTGTAFTKHYAIPLGWSRRYWGETQREGLLTVDLTQEPDASSWPPKKRDEFGRIPATDGGDEPAE